MVATWRILCRQLKFCSVLQHSSLFWFWILAKMVRHRKGKHALDSSKDHDDRSKFTRRRGKQPSLKPFLLLAAVFGIPLCIFGAFKLWNYRLSTRLYTPLNAPLVINKSESDMSRFWGTYRSNLYFGLRWESEIMSILVKFLRAILTTTSILLRGTLKFITELVATLWYLEYFLGMWQKIPFFVVGKKNETFLRRGDGTVLGLSLG